MHANSPHAGPADPDVSVEHRRALRRDLAAVAAETRELLSDEFVVGAELSGHTEGLRATVAVQPPAGSVVSAGFDGGADATPPDALALDLAAGAVVEAKRSARGGPRPAR